MPLWLDARSMENMSHQRTLRFGQGNSGRNLNAFDQKEREYQQRDRLIEQKVGPMIVQKKNFNLSDTFDRELYWAIIRRVNYMLERRKKSVDALNDPGFAETFVDEAITRE